jgi:hypothetical protein
LRRYAGISTATASFGKHCACFSVLGISKFFIFILTAHHLCGKKSSTPEEGCVT